MGMTAVHKPYFMIEMKKDRSFASIVLLSFAVLLAALSPAVAYAAAPGKPTATSADSKETREEMEWRAQRARELSSPDGWLTLVGLEWLKPGKNAVGLAADNQIQLKGHAPEHLAVIDVEGGQVRLAAPEGGFPAHLMVDGQPAKEG